MLEILNFAKKKSGVPGSDVLLYGDKTRGFYGEVPASEFITGEALAEYLGIQNAGVFINQGIGWLKISADGKTIFTPKRPFMSTITWASLYQAGAVYGTNDNGTFPLTPVRKQDARITINKNEYIIRLMRSHTADPSTGGSNTNEWHCLRTMTTATWNTVISKADLGFEPTGIPGIVSMSMNTYSANTINRLGQGNNFNGANQYSPTIAATNNGWRPYLELVV